MNEKEARTKYCPFLIAGFYAGAGSGEDANTNCAASDCMMWTVDQPAYMITTTDSGIDESEEHPEQGRCGLAK